LATRLHRDVVQYFRLALGTKPYNVYFLCHIPVRNLDNVWNATNLDGCIKAKTLWVKVISKKDRNTEGYEVIVSKSEMEGRGSPFPEPMWPSDDIDTLIAATFEGRMIMETTDPARLRLVGDRQKIS
jgi:hypothetical protein